MKKLFKVFAVMLCVLATGLALVACKNEPQHQHDYQFDSFVWNEEVSGSWTAQAKYVCSGNSEHIELHDAEISVLSTTAATCTTTGSKVYRANYDGHTDDQTETFAALEHNYEFDSFVWDKTTSGSWTAQAKYVCSRNGEHIELHAAEISVLSTTAATCTTTGSKVYRASYDGHNDEQTETIAALEHNYEFDSFVWDKTTSGNWTAQAKYVCSRNGEHIELYAAEISVLSTTAATCTTTGSKVYRATYDGHTDDQTETFAALEHNYEFDSFVWDRTTSGSWTAQAKYVCSRNGEHTELHAAEISVLSTTPSTCAAAGSKVYRATYDGHTDDQTETFAKLSHSSVQHGFCTDCKQPIDESISPSDFTDYLTDIEAGKTLYSYYIPSEWDWGYSEQFGYFLSDANYLIRYNNITFNLYLWDETHGFVLQQPTTAPYTNGQYVTKFWYDVTYPEEYCILLFEIESTTSYPDIRVEYSSWECDHEGALHHGFCDACNYLADDVVLMLYDTNVPTFDIEAGLTYYFVICDKYYDDFYDNGANIAFVSDSGLFDPAKVTCNLYSAAEYKSGDEEILSTSATNNQIAYNFDPYDLFDPWYIIFEITGEQNVSNATFRLVNLND